MTKEITPQREQLLSDIFEIVQEHDALSDEGIVQALQTRNINVEKREIDIALCMLEGRGLIAHFTKEADSSDSNTRRTKRPHVEFLYKAAESQQTEPEESTPPKPGFLTRLLGLE
ncbi:MAG: hypothetical protein ACLFR0_04100 [Alphaproteobacteria bacterium]